MDQSRMKNEQSLNGRHNSGSAATPPLVSAKPPGEEPEQTRTDCNYEKELRRLQVEMVKLQEWVRYKGLRVIVIFEGRDAAGKGGAIKRITESLNPRVCRVVALAAPT